MKKKRLKSRCKLLIISFMFFIFIIELYILKQNMDSNVKVKKGKEDITICEQTNKENISDKGINNYEQTERELDEETSVEKIIQKERRRTKKQISEEISKIDEEYNTKEKNTQNNDLEDIDIYNIIINEANASQEFVDKLVKQILLIPDNIIEDFYKKGWNICITNKDLRDSPEVRKDIENGREIFTILGLVDWSEHKIYLANNGDAIKKYVIIHEYGHYTDAIYKWESLKKDWTKICEEERHIIIGESVMDNDSELFAEIFKYVILEREENKDTQAYQYVKEIIETNS